MFNKFTDPSVFMKGNTMKNVLNEYIDNLSGKSVVNHVSKKAPDGGSRTFESSSSPNSPTRFPGTTSSNGPIKTVNTPGTNGSSSANSPINHPAPKPAPTGSVYYPGTNTKPTNESIQDTLLMSQQLRPINRDIYNQIVAEHLDMTDIDTVQQAMSLNEAEQNTMLLSLTNKLYQMIIGKVDNIDYGDIPNTKGNITKLPKYKQMRECINLLRNIFAQYKENPDPVNTIDKALTNLENYSDLFIASYAGEIELGKMTYENTALGVVSSLGFMISVCIEYIKNPKKEGLDIVLNKTGVHKVKDFIVFESLEKFNKACENNDIEKALRPLIQNKVKNMFGIGTAMLSSIHMIAVIPVVLVALLPFIKQLVYFFFSSRVRASSYFDAQADLLEMNAAELQSNEAIHTEDDRKRVIARQLKIAGLFHDIANKISIDSKEAENTATKELKNDSKAIKMDEIESNPGAMNDDPLF